MPTHQNSTFSLELAQNYFAQLNPIAVKIARDIHDTKLAYGQLWNRLNPTEHNEIINETLMKPEISLRYFDKFSLSSSVSRISFTSKDSSSCDSNDSFTAVVLKNANDASTTNDLIQHESKSAKSPKSCAQSSFRHYSGFDRRNLCTFAIQKVALKIIHDEVLGAYRDEHSKPFSYKTKSQINLYTFANNEQSDDQICLLASTDSERFMLKTQDDINNQQTLTNYKNLQTELINHIDKTKEKDLVDVSSSCYQCFYNDSKNEIIPAANVMSNNNTEPINKTSARQVMPTNAAKKELFKSYIDSERTSAPSSTYAVYSDTYYEHEESMNLMQNYSIAGISNAFSSSTVTSDDHDEEDDDEKTICEDVKLLDKDISLRKGFDFLNNW